MTWLRSLLFNVTFYVLTAIIAVLLLPVLVGPHRWLMLGMGTWARLVIFSMSTICGIRLRVEGKENLPAQGAALIAAKHHSTFDTIVWLSIFPDTAYVLKRELLWIPLYGWIARGARMISVDRDAGPSAMRTLLIQGRAAAKAGRQIVIFPEGTRVPPGVHGTYQPGIVALSAATGLPVIPVATDSGLCWGRRAFRKKAGTITVLILPALPVGLRRNALLARLKSEIEGATDRLLANQLERFPVPSNCTAQEIHDGNA